MFEELFLVVNHSIAAAGVLVIAYSAAKSAFLFIQGLRGISIDINRIRLELGYGIILGLEFMVAADIIASIAKPNFYDIGMLAALVLIRTFLSYFLNQELQALAPETKKAIGDVSR